MLFGTLYTYDGTMTQHGNIRLYPVETATTLANTPYFIMSNGSAISATDVDVVPWQNTEVTGDNQIVGVSQEVVMPVGAYTYDGNDHLNRVTKNNKKVSAGYAFFLLPDFNETDTVLLIFDDIEVTTDIRNHQRTEQAQTWYTLDGRKLSGRPTQKGSYIVCPADGSSKGRIVIIPASSSRTTNLEKSK